MRGVIPVPNDNLSKLNWWLKKSKQPVELGWLRKLNDPVINERIKKLREPMEYQYRGGLINRYDDSLNQKRFEGEQRSRQIAAMEELQKVMTAKRIAKEAEELRRHNELVEVGQKQVEHLAGLLVDSNNAIEQRNAIIRFMVESMVASDQPKETKMKKLLEYSTQFATLAGGANDVMQIIDEAIKKMN